MAHLLFIPSDMSATAEDMTRGAADLVGTVPRLVADASVVMPPAVAAETAGVIAQVGAEMTAASGFYAMHAADLAARAAAILAEEAAGGLMSPLSSWLMENGPVVGGPIGGPLTVGLSSRILKALFGSPAERAVAWRSISDLYGGPLHEIESFGSDALNAEKEIGLVSGNSTWIAGAKALERDPLVAGFDKVNSVLGYIGDAVDVHHGWQDSQGELLVGRAFTTLTTGASEVAIDRFPVTAVANFLSLNSLKADAAAVGDMGGAGISGMIKGGEQGFRQDQHDLETGNIPGLLAHSAGGAGSAAIAASDTALNTWSDRVSHGDFGTPLKWMATGENWVIDKTYGPISNVTADISHSVGSAAYGAAHLVGRGLQHIGL